jgi:hypothetical protein
MRGAVLLATAAGVIALVFGFTVFSRSTHSGPALRIFRAAPLTVERRRFGASEVVRLTTDSGRRPLQHAARRSSGLGGQLRDREAAARADVLAGALLGVVRYYLLTGDRH